MLYYVFTPMDCFVKEQFLRNCILLSGCNRWWDVDIPRWLPTPSLMIRRGVIQRREKVAMDPKVCGMLMTMRTMFRKLVFFGGDWKLCDWKDNLFLGGRLIRNTERVAPHHKPPILALEIISSSHGSGALGHCGWQDPGLLADGCRDVTLTQLPVSDGGAAF